MIDLTGYGVPLGYRQVRIHCYVDLRTQPVSYPSRPNLCHGLHAGDIAYRLLDLVDHLGVHTVKQAGKYRPAALPDDHQDRRCDDESHDGVGQRVAQPHPSSANDHGQARPAVCPGVVAVSDERRAAYLSAHPDAEDRHRLVACEAYCTRDGDGPEQPHRLRLDEPIYGLVSGNDRAEEDDEYNNNPGQVLHSAVAEREAPAGSQTGECEGDPERYGGHGAPEIVDGIPGEGEAARQHDHHQLPQPPNETP